MRWYWKPRNIEQYRHDEIVAILRQLEAKVDTIMADLTAIQAEVTNETTVVASVVKLVNSLADQITAAGTDPAALQAIVDTMRANDTALADAVTAHTPTPLPVVPAALVADGELHPTQSGNPASTPANY